MKISVKTIRPITFISVFLFFGIQQTVHSQQNNNLFEYWQYYSDAENTLYKHITGIALQQLDSRRQSIRALQDKEDILNHQKQVKEKLERIIGPFPERTPLNAKITGKLKGDGFRVEKILFESQPGFFVTSALFLPERRKGKLPAIIYCSGHTFDGFRSVTYQHLIINLVRKGFIVFAFDPVGQGERLQYLDDSKEKSIFSSPTGEHSFAGAQCFITGSSMARYMIWDGIRSVDYLISRKEVDPEKIGITGRSGGGTQSAYIAAFDPRIKAVAPENYITSFERILTSIGPQDAEQNFPGGIVNGIDHADLLEIRTPKPALIIGTYNDFFSFQGVLDTYNEAKDFYGKIGASDKINLVVDDGGHESTLQNRQAMYAFFQEHLQLPGSTTDLDIQPFKKTVLNVTETGQVLTSKTAETVYSLNRKEALEKIEKIKSHREEYTDNHDRVINAAIKLTGYTKPSGDPEITHSGRIVTDSTILTRYLVNGSGDYQLPMVLLIPAGNTKKSVILYFDPEGKTKAIAQNPQIQHLLISGYPVVVADLPGTGELGPGYLKGDAYIGRISYNQWFAGILTGKSITGVRSQDINILRKSLDKIEELSGLPVTGVAQGYLTTDLVHAAAFENGFEHIILVDPLFSWELVVTHEHYDPAIIPSAVPNALSQYDIPDIIASIAPGKITLVNPSDHAGIGLEQEQIANDINYLRKCWIKTGSPDNIRIRIINKPDYQINAIIE